MSGPIREFQGEFRFLSNFWMTPIEFDGEVWPSAEHAYQAAKTVDRAWRTRIKFCKTPGLAKRMGKSVPIRNGWEGRRLEVMLRIVRIKFLYDYTLARQLMATGDRELIEGNRWGDTFWGVCNGVGENHLGRILMQVRAELVNDPSGTSVT